jgi:hypothetical protein
MGKIDTTSPHSHEERVAAALNQQGFLFSQVIREKIRFDRPGSNRPQKAWKFLTEEFSVTATDGTQTRIDLVLDSGRNTGTYVCIECKRMNPLYKDWVFFDRRRGPGGEPQMDAYFESFRLSGRPIRPEAPPHHGMERCSIGQMPFIFTYYLEVAVDKQNKPGSTETIEAAFQQITRGQAGFMAKQLEFEGPFKAVAIPVVVTTAKLYEARFDEGQISLNAGTIEPSMLKLDPMEFCAVNYHANDQLAVRSKYSPPLKTIELDMEFGQIRTVFVVQSEAILKFLDWLDTVVRL